MNGVSTKQTLMVLLTKVKNAEPLFFENWARDNFHSKQWNSNIARKFVALYGGFSVLKLLNSSGMEEIYFNDLAMAIGDDRASAVIKRLDFDKERVVGQPILRTIVCTCVAAFILGPVALYATRQDAPTEPQTEASESQSTSTSAMPTSSPVDRSVNVSRNGSVIHFDATRCHLEVSEKYQTLNERQKGSFQVGVTNAQAWSQDMADTTVNEDKELRGCVSQCLAAIQEGGTCEQ